jgi:hypothetical protein
VPNSGCTATAVGAAVYLSQYGEFRTGFNGDKEDTRMVVWGLRYVLENYVMRQWTVEDVERADIFYRYSREAAVRTAKKAAEPAACPALAVQQQDMRRQRL